MAFPVQRDDLPPFATQERCKARPVVLLVIATHKDRLRRRKVRHLFRTFLQPGHPRTGTIGIEQVAHKRYSSGPHPLHRAGQLREQGAVLMHIGHG